MLGFESIICVCVTFNFFINQMVWKRIYLKGQPGFPGPRGPPGASGVQGEFNFPSNVLLMKYYIYIILYVIYLYSVAVKATT